MRDDQIKAPGPTKLTGHAPRDLGFPVQGEPGEWNAITDVPALRWDTRP
jgi:hypothetical protein